MILEKEYQRERAVMYARKYALVRNPLFATFAGIGGNCTNFASQAVLAGSCVMNFTPIYGWYYLSLNRRSASWSGVQFFYNFIVGNEDVGPYGVEADISVAEIGDIIQLQNEEGTYYHTLVITQITEDEIYICANSNDALDRPLSSYNYASLRLIHILGVRYDTRYQIDCFESLYSPPIPTPPAPPQDSQAEQQPNEQSTPPRDEMQTEDSVPQESQTSPEQ